MTDQAKLTDTQTAILKAAAGRPEGNIEPMSPTLRGGARAKVIECLLAHHDDQQQHHRQPALLPLFSGLC